MSEYSAFLKHLGIDKKQMLASMLSKIPESEKPSERGREMTKEEQLKQEAAEYAKENFCDEVRATARNAYLDCAKLKEKRITELEAQIEKMKSDVRGNIKWADQNKNEQMYCKLNAMINQWR